MFSLIVTIISIALVAALAIATIYYGGSQFLKGSAKAKASTAINGAQQINGAEALYTLDNGGTDVSDIVSDDGIGIGKLVSPGVGIDPYLQAAPQGLKSGEVWNLASGTEIWGDVESKEVCEAINSTVGATGVDLTAAILDADADRMYSDETGFPVGVPYACIATDVTAGAEVYTFVYK